MAGGYTRHKLGQLGLLDRFEVVMGEDDAGSPKPDPGSYRAVLGRLGVAAADTVHVGDRYLADGLGACEAGLRGVWLDRPGADPDGRRPAGGLDPRVAVVRALTDVVALALG